MGDWVGSGDREVYHAIAEGSDDPQLWTEFLDRFQGPCYRVIRRSLLRRMGNEAAQELADEMFQDFFMSLLRNKRRLLKRYRGDGGCTPKTYLCYLAGYHVLTELRSRKTIPDLYRSNHETLDDPEHPSHQPLREPRPDHVVANREVLNDALEVLGELSDLDRRIFEFIYVQRLSLKQIVELTGEASTTLRVQHHRMRKRLKKSLEARGHRVDDAALQA